jgi:hypothetical protein
MAGILDKEEAHKQRIVNAKTFREENANSFVDVFLGLSEHARVAQEARRKKAIDDLCTKMWEQLRIGSNGERISASVPIHLEDKIYYEHTAHILVCQGLNTSMDELEQKGLQLMVEVVNDIPCLLTGKMVLEAVLTRMC